MLSCRRLLLLCLARRQRGDEPVQAAAAAERPAAKGARRALCPAARAGAKAQVAPAGESSNGCCRSGSRNLSRENAGASLVVDCVCVLSNFRVRWLCMNCSRDPISGDAWCTSRTFSRAQRCVNLLPTLILFRPLRLQRRPLHVRAVRRCACSRRCRGRPRPRPPLRWTPPPSTGW